MWRNEHHRGRRPAVWSPGEYLVIDWAEAAPGLFLFCAVLAFSRWRFVAFATDQRASTTLALIAEALGAIGGVPARVLADRMACLKGGVVANVVIPTAEYVRLAGHYGFAPDFCHASDPAIEGHRGELVRLRPTRPGRPAAHRGRHRRHHGGCARCQCRGRRLVRGGQRAVHSEICAVPDERLIVERRTAATVAVAAPADRGTVGDPQGRPAVVCPVCLGPLLGAHPADRRPAWPWWSITARSAWWNPRPG